ncbi:MAG TPA: class I SAM-dependent methyltransferase [Actinomycetota bacterium]|nr:class I SAM-dependent methyltransferase [Actinomycetota bacterium]
MTAVDRWARALAAWAIPAGILAAAPESPYGFPAELFRTRGERVGPKEVTPTTERALEALPEDGSVLDVGCGGGATSLPLAGRAGALIGVDAQEDMLEGFLANARAAGVRAQAVRGRWPDASTDVGPADVAVAGHVLYDVGDLEPFIHALAQRARRGVVLELTERHPLHWMNDLWLRFHDLARPEGPSADDAREVIAELGFRPALQRWTAPSRAGGFDERADAVALLRRRLCLAPDRDDELEEALGARLQRREGLWSAGPTDQPLVTIWFDP